MASTLSAALFYAKELNWPVIPIWPIDFDGDVAKCRCGNKDCRSVGKHPINAVDGFQMATRGVADATTNPAKIKAWWRMVPDANIGVRGDKFFALDVDDADALFDLTSHNGRLPDTIESISGSGGCHILFKQPDDYMLGNEEGKLPRGINVRGGRGYILVPPSIHKTGNRYQFELSSHPRDGVELAPAPQWLLDLIGKPTETKIDVVEVSDSVPNLDKLDMHQSIKELIRTAPVEGEDRSASDQKAIVALISAGCQPSEVKAIFSSYPIGLEGKYAERGDDYLDRSIARAVSYVGPVTRDRTEESIVVPGKAVAPHEARMEQMAMASAYIKGWHDALVRNKAVVEDLWPNLMPLPQAAIDLYNLGMRTDYVPRDDNSVELPALVVPYKLEGEVNNVQYEVSDSRPGMRSRADWERESGSRVFQTDPSIDADKGSQVLIADDWDVAIHTYLNYGHVFKWLSIFGFPQAPDKNSPLVGLRELADLLANSERILLAWPASRLKEGIALANSLEDGSERVRWLGMPAPMRQMYTTYGLTEVYLNRFIQQAPPVC